MKDLLQNVKHFQSDSPKDLVPDKEDYTVMKYGVNCTFRGRQVCYIIIIIIIIIFVCFVYF